MAKKKYECIGILPLEFHDGKDGKTVQYVETGETFERDFATTSGEEHERWLIQLGHIREVFEPAQVIKTPARPTVQKESE